MLLSPQANLFEAILAKIAADVPVIRYIEQDLGQLENYDIRPAVSWPCCLIDIEEMKFSNSGAHLQHADGIVTCRIGLVKYTDSSNLTPPLIRENALQYYEVENLLFTALHAYNPPGFGKLIRLASATEKRDDDIRVRVIKFAISYTDNSAAPVTQTIAVPSPVIGVAPTAS